MKGQDAGVGTSAGTGAVSAMWRVARPLRAGAPSRNVAAAASAPPLLPLGILDGQVTTASRTGREQDGSEAEHADRGGEHTGGGVEAVAEELASVDH